MRSIEKSHKFQSRSEAINHFHLFTKLDCYLSFLPENFSIVNFFVPSQQTLIHNGGVIPKQLYKTESVDEPDGNELDDCETDGDDVTGSTKIKLNEVNLYQNIKLRPGQFHEIVIKNDDHRAVLTWDFESVKTEVLFTIFETDGDLNVTNGELCLMISCNSLKFTLTFFLTR